MSSTSNPHPYEPHQLADGRWQVGGLVTSGPCTRLTALLFIGRHFYDVPEAMEYAYWEFAEAVWNRDPDNKLMEKHDWSQTIISDLAHEKYVGFGGCGSSGKSHVVSGWGVFRWLCAPSETIVLITTTSLKDADQRVWGSVIHLMEPLMGAIPVRERPSLHDYVFQPDGQKMKVNRGIFLVAAEKKKTKEAMGRFVGKKAKHIILIADELGELSPAIMNAAISNLSKGGSVSFQAVGMSNPDSRFDAFGIWVEPEDGWESVDATVATQWRTKWHGLYRRFDAYDSPHLYREKSYLPTDGDIEEARELLGENSRAFLRMWRAIFFNGSDEAGVYTELELSKSGALSPVPSGTIKTVIGRVGGLDPGYTWGGDRTLFRAAEIGYADDGRLVLAYHPLEPIREDVGSSEPRTYQIAQQLMVLANKYKVPIRHIAVDATAGGNSICDVIDVVARESTLLLPQYRGNCIRVQFGGSPTDSRPNPRVKKTAKELYKNRVTELWFVGKDFYRNGQIFGLDGDTAREMTNREYNQKKAGSGLRVQLETKDEYKDRTKLPSPDAADTSFLALDAARSQFSFLPIERRKEDDPKQWKSPPRNLAQMDMAGQNADAWL